VPLWNRLSSLPNKLLIWAAASSLFLPTTVNAQAEAVSTYSYDVIARGPGTYTGALGPGEVAFIRRASFVFFSDKVLAKGHFFTDFQGSECVGRGIVVPKGDTVRYSNASPPVTFNNAVTYNVRGADHSVSVSKTDSVSSSWWQRVELTLRLQGGACQLVTFRIQSADRGVQDFYDNGSTRHVLSDGSQRSWTTTPYQCEVLPLSQFEEPKPENPLSCK